MFELIGIAVVAFIVWTIGKSIVGGSIKGTLLRAREYAERAGVPRDFSRDLIEYPDIVKQARPKLASGDRGFAALAVYEQYGKTIVHLHAKARQVEMLRLKKEVGDAFNPQCDRLYDYGACYVSALYISALTAALARMMPTYDELREVFDHCFSHPNLEVSRDRAWERMMSLPHSGDDFLAMGELVKREVAVKKFEFFFNLRVKYQDIYEEGVSEKDLAAADPHWYLKL